MTENQLITLRYHWDSSGGWYEIPKKLLDKVDDFRPMGSDSRISKDRQTLYLDAELDGQRFINELRKLKGLKPTARNFLLRPDVSEGIQIMEICDGARSSIRDLESALVVSRKNLTGN